MNRALTMVEAVWRRWSASGWLPPVAERELRIASRRGSMYWSRTVPAALVIVIAAWWVMTTTQDLTSGGAVFGLLGTLAAVLVAAGALTLTAPAFAREKREGTLGLLLLTPLRPRDIVTGKLFSCCLGAMNQLVALIPVLAVPLLAGGVTPGRFLLLVLVLLNHAFFAACLGLYISARSWTEHRSHSLTASVWFALCILLPGALGMMFGGVGATMNGDIFLMMLGTSPLYTIGMTLFSDRPATLIFWGSFLITTWMGVLFFRATCRLLPHCWQDQPRVRTLMAESAVESATPAPATPTEGTQASPPTQRETVPANPHDSRVPYSGPGLPSRREDPLGWFAARWWPTSTASAWFNGIAAVVVPFGAYILGSQLGPFDPMVSLWMFFFWNASVKFQVVQHAAYAFAPERPESGLDLLLSTPVSAGELVRAEVRVMKSRLMPRIQKTLLAEVIWLGIAMAAGWRFYDESGLRVPLLVISLILPLLLLLDTWALAWVGLWQGALAVKPRQAATRTTGQVLLLPWLITIVCVPLIRIFEQSGWGVIILVTAGSVLVDLMFGLRARAMLRVRLPELARVRGSK